jgi:hypothetical protein
MAFVHVVVEGHDVYFPEHSIFWIEVKRSYEDDELRHVTTICGKHESGLKYEQAFDCEPKFLPSNG